MTFKYFNVKNGLTTGNIALHSANGNVVANTFVGSLNVTGSANLGNVSNLVITGGTANYVLTTDGAGNLSWSAPSGGNGVSAVSDNFTGNGVQTTFALSTEPSNINLTFVNYNGALLLREDYTISGSNIVFDTPPGNGYYIEVTTIEGSGGGGGGSSSSISNGNSNVNIATANGNITFSSAGNANVVLVTGTGANVTGTLNVTGNANVGNIGGNNAIFTSVAGTLTTAAQPNITSVGTLSTVSVTGNANVGNINATNGAFTGNLSVTGGIADSSGANYYTIGYREVPQNSRNSAYTFVNSDNGKHVYYTGGAATLTLPTDASTTGGAFPVGAVLTVVNNGSGNLTIGTSTTLFQAGTANTGNRTLATKGLATIMKVASDTWFITGTGLT